MVYKFFDKKSIGSGVSTSLRNKSATESNYQLANELHKQIIRKFKKRKVYLSFRDNIWGVDLGDVQSLSKYNKGIKYLLCAIDLLSKYAWVVPLKNKKRITVANAFHKLISKGRKPNKIWVDKSGEFLQELFGNKNIEIFSTYNEGKPVTERLIRTLKIKIFKYMVAVYFDV